MDFLMPGRPIEDDDYEAQSSLRTLLEAHKIVKTADEDLFDRMREIISYNQECLSQVDEMLDSDGDGIVGLFYDKTEDRTDTRTVDDFFNRLNRSRREERARNLTPLKKDSHR